jgi:hypothetical protein
MHIGGYLRGLKAGQVAVRDRPAPGIEAAASRTGQAGALIAGQFLWGMAAG